MKSYEEVVSDVFRKGDERIQKNRRRIAAVRNVSAIACSFCAVIVLFGVISNKSDETDVSNNTKMNIHFSDNIYSLETEINQTSVTTAAHSSESSTSATDFSGISSTKAFTEHQVYTETESNNVMQHESDIIATTIVSVSEYASESSESVSAEPIYSGSCGKNAYFEYDESTGTLHIMGSSDYNEPIDLDSIAHLYDKINNLVLDKGITAILKSEKDITAIGGSKRSDDNIISKILIYTDDLTVYHYNDLNDIVWLKLYFDIYYKDQVKFINPEIESVSGADCGDDLWFDYDMDTRSLYFHGTGNYMDESKVQYLVGFIDKVYIDKSIVTLGKSPENHIFIPSAWLNEKLTLYHYREYSGVEHLKTSTGDYIEFINLDEESLQ